MAFEGLDFEEALVALRKEIAAARSSPDSDPDHLQRLVDQHDALARELFSRLTAWQVTQVARHANRPYTLDYISMLFEDFSEIHGDRSFGDDPALVCGTALFRGQPVVVIGHQKGRDMKQRIYRNFGQPKPEGYRKALRVMKMAEKFARPIICLIDTPGAYPGIDAEERGQAEAIARNLREMSAMRVPIVVVVTGEGGSGGALAIGVGDRVMILQNAIYSVISPEGCAAILWKDARMAETAAEKLGLTASKLLALGLVDAVLPEPPGGAHADPQAAAETVGASIAKSLSELQRLTPAKLLDQRYEKFRRMGVFTLAAES
ncbi:MAG: acetyl-CoA carboxylase carboxyltransferase subunit alpha [Acidobacteria bacterium]|nr:acetyl-CoA carboxylase carboxyltransferase subunit alpha [Acidobacteriota bacterium]